MISEYYELHKNGRIEKSSFDKFIIDYEFAKLISKFPLEDIVIIRHLLMTDIVKSNKHNDQICRFLNDLL